MFKIGDRVVCIKQKEDFPVLVVGRHYIVYDVLNCCEQEIDIGLEIAKGYNCCVCAICDNIIDTSGKFFLEAKLFRKVEEQKEVQYVKQEIEIEEPILN